MGGTVLTQPDGGGGAENRAKEVLQGAAGARLSEQTSELRTFPRWRGGEQETLELFPAEGGSRGATLGKSLMVTLCLELSSG